MYPVFPQYVWRRASQTPRTGPILMVDQIARLMAWGRAPSRCSFRREDAQIPPIDREQPLRSRAARRRSRDTMSRGSFACAGPFAVARPKKRFHIWQTSPRSSSPPHLLRQRRAHLGTAYCTMLCDVQARYRRAAGYDVKFLTAGMDEHGEGRRGRPAARLCHPAGVVRQPGAALQGPLEAARISNDDFIRTTEPRQNHAVQYLWERMRESGYLYKGSYDGWYCVPEETYFTENQVKKSDEERGAKGEHLCPDCGRPLERASRRVLLLQALRLPGQAPGALRRSAPTSSSRPSA